MMSKQSRDYLLSELGTDEQIEQRPIAALHFIKLLIADLEEWESQREVQQ